MTDTAIDNMADPRQTAKRIIGPANDLVTADELAEFLHLSTGFIYKLARQKRIPSIRIGRSVRFDINAVERALMESTIRGH